MKINFLPVVVLCWAFTFMAAGSVAASPLPQANHGDGIFTPTIAPVTAIDKTGHPTTVAVAEPEPRIAQFMAAGTATGDSYIIHFPQGDAGGPCVFAGTARYRIDANGTLTIQALADCGNLHRGYSYMICRLNASLRCTEAPWWYFRGRTYAITKDGVVVSGGAAVPWNDLAAAPQLIENTAASIRAMNERIKDLTSANTVHFRSISCREFHPETKSYAIHEFPLTCMVQSLCNGMPDVSAQQDGDLIDWNSPAGRYVQQKSKTSDFSNWFCWLRTQ